MVTHLLSMQELAEKIEILLKSKDVLVQISACCSKTDEEGSATDIIVKSSINFCDVPDNIEHRTELISQQNTDGKADAYLVHVKD